MAMMSSRRGSIELAMARAMRLTTRASMLPGMFCAMVLAMSALTGAAST